MVISPNGYISKPDGNEDWIAEINWDDFVADVKKCNNLIVGRTTYEVVQELDEVEAKYKVVVTSKEDFTVRPGYIIVHSPQEAVDYLTGSGIEEILLIGGGKINGSFAEAGLIDELELMVEPYLVSKGKQVFRVGDYEFALKLKKVEQVSGGRVHLLYEVKK